MIKKKRIAWNKGLTKETDERVRKASETMKENYRSGKRVAWQTGLTKNTDPRVSKQASAIRKSWIGRKPSEKFLCVLKEYNENRVITDETRRKLSIARKKYLETHDGPNKGRKWSEETKAKLREARMKQKLPTRNTLIERLMVNELLERNICFQTHIPLCDICQPDIVFSERQIAVFCDGDYWHSKEFEDGKRWEHDREVDRVLKENDWRVFRFWGSEIKEDVNRCVDQVISVLSGE